MAELPPISYGVTRERLERESPAYLELIIDAGNKDPQKNIEFREHVLALCRVDREFRALVYEICRREPLFWCNTFAVVIEPRGASGNKVLPFITYEMQDRFVLDVYPCQGVRGTVTLKSRDTGWTWMMYGIIRPHRFIFSDGATVVCGSRKDSLVDSTENPDTMFAKFDAVMERIPWWMAPKYDIKNPKCKQQLHRWNPENGAVMTGASTAEDFSRGGRRTEADIDEFAAWDVAKSYAADGSVRFATDCLNLGSTPCGDVGAFRDAWFNDTSPALKLELRWEDHPIYRKGLYSSREGVLEILDDSYWNRPGFVCSRWVGNEFVQYTRETYPFILDDQIRSVWFDAKEAELGSPVRVAQELRRSFTGSDNPFFDHATLLRVETKYAKPPLMVGRAEIDPESCRLIRFVPDQAGLLLLWELPDDRGRMPPEKSYVIGVDVSAGTRGAQASNSVISVFDRKTWVQVAELATNLYKPGRLGEIANAIGHWFNRAMIGWEAGTHGDTFMDRLFTELGYPNVYYQRQNELEGGATKIKRSPGWWVRPKNKMDAFNKFAASQVQEQIRISSAACIREQRQFVWVGPEEVAHRRSLSAESPSERKGSHGDRVSAAVIAFKMLDEYHAPPDEKVDIERPWTLQWLLNKADAEKTKDASTFMPTGRLYGSKHPI